MHEIRQEGLELPEANRFLAKARKLLEHATAMLGVGLNEDAGRTAYRERFPAAQAFIFETTRLADYETGPGSEISAPRGRFANKGARRDAVETYKGWIFPSLARDIATAGAGHRNAPLMSWWRGWRAARSGQRCGESDSPERALSLDSPPGQFGKESGSRPVEIDKWAPRVRRPLAYGD